MASVIIPARGGSKSVPRKNLKPVAGLPLIVHTILAARQASATGHVYVTTDDKEIAAVASQYGARVIERPAELATDDASSESALIHALEVMDRAHGDRPDIVVFLQCTSPFTTPAHVDGLVRTLTAEGADSALIVQKTHSFLWARSPLDGSARGVNHDPRHRPRRQDRPAEFIETGAGYAFKREGFLAARHRFFGRVALFEVQDVPALEIDEPEDLLRAEALMLTRRMQKRPLPLPVGLIVFDFDGVMTDDRVIVGSDGSEQVLCSRGDGMGIEFLRKAGIPMLVLSKEKNKVVEMRCRKLGLDFVQGLEDKLSALKRILAERRIDASHCIYMGNDVNDLPPMTLAGFTAAPADARPEVKARADLILDAPGGRGAVRALADIVLQSLPAPG